MNLNITQSGSGPNLILFHGWAMHSGIFSPVIPFLNAHFHVHCVDLPGHGKSHDCTIDLDFDSVWQAVTHQISEPAYYLGWSLGGLFALHGALKNSSHCLGLIMQNASPCFVQRAHWPAGMPAQVFQQFADELTIDYAHTLLRFFMLEAQGSENLRKDLRLLQETAFQYGKPDSRTLLTGLALLQETDFSANLSHLNCPSLWLAGRRDRLVNPQAMHAASVQAKGTFVCDEHGGHAPFLTHPEWLCQQLVHFIETPHATT